MHVDLTPEQQMMLDTIDRFLARQWPIEAVRAVIGSDSADDDNLWNAASEMGWQAILVPEEYGGGSVSGDAYGDAAILMQLCGRWLVPGPAMPSTAIAAAISRSANPSHHAPILTDLATGTCRGAVAVAERGSLWGVDGTRTGVERRGGALVLSGRKLLVQDGDSADVFAVTAKLDGDVTVLLVPRRAPGVEVETMMSLDLTRQFSTVRFDEVQLEADAAIVNRVGERNAAEILLDELAVWTCADTVGALERTFNMTLEYAGDRYAFGRPVASFQAIKHRFAEMLLALESCTAITATAVAALAAANSSDDAAAAAEARQLAAAAKHFVSKHAVTVARQCVQIFGGIGCTWECDLHLYLRRIETNAGMYGRSEHHLDTLSRTLGVGAGAA